MKSINIVLPPDRKDVYENGIKYSMPSCATAVLLITDDDKKVLFDTGAFGSAQKLIDGLKKYNLTPLDIDYVILSHAHFDHNANLYLFENAELLYHKWRVSLKNGKTERFPGKTPRVAIEGIEFLYTPGHTEDSISILCNYEGKKYAIVGDAVKISLIKQGVLKGYSDTQLYYENMKKLFDIADVIISGEDGIIEGKRFQETKELLTHLKVE